MTVQEEVIIWEGRLLERLADVNARLMKQLVRGRSDSEIVSSYADLRNIANYLESIAADGRKIDAMTDRPDRAQTAPSAG